MRLLPRLTDKQVEELERFTKETKDLQEFKRAQAILLLNKRVDEQTIRSITAFSRSQIFSLRQTYLHTGMSGLETKRKGDPKRLLTKKQLKEVVHLIKTTKPQEYGYSYPFWTTGILAEVIKEKFKVHYKSRTSYYIIFKKSTFTYHKPGRVSVRRDEEQVKQWRERAKNIIKKYWDDPSTIILCEDEVILSTMTTFQKIWLPEGEYPKIEMETVRKNKSIYGFLNMKNGKHHAFSFERQNMYITTKALQKVRRIYPKNKQKGNKLPAYHILLLWDNVGWHKGSKVQEYIQKDGKITQLWFPPYSPEENPEEHVWKQTKQEKIHNRLIQNIENITNEVIVYLNNHYFPYSLLDHSPVS